MVDDLEIVAATVKYCRAARPGTQAQEILTWLAADFPEADAEQIKRCVADAAMRLARQADFK